MSMITKTASLAALAATCGVAEAALNIDVGRQLFVDDWLVGSTQGVVRTFYHPQKYGDAPVLWPETPIERDAKGPNGERLAPCAVAVPGGLWWDSTRQKFRLWYECGWMNHVCYAESADGLRWERPDLGVVPGTNRVFKDDKIDSWTVFPDYGAENPFASWKLYISSEGGITENEMLESPDGFAFKSLGQTGKSGDATTLYYDPFRGKWIFSLRDYRKCVRCRAFWESAEFGGKGCQWVWGGAKKDPATAPKQWLEAAKTDVVEGWPAKYQKQKQLYMFDAVAYESLMLGVWRLHSGPENHVCVKEGMPKVTELHFSFSRDGWTYDRPDPTAAIPASGWGSGRWDSSYLAAVGGICVIKDERLWFYYSAFRGDRTAVTDKRITGSCEWRLCGMHFNGSIGVATLRRDGFAGMVADGRGELVTKPVEFSGSRLFVNADCRFGSLVAEVLDESGAPVKGFAAADCTAVSRADTTKAEVRFAGGDLLRFAGRPVSFRFKLHCATLFSFWVSKGPDGRSGGYLAAGGPDYKGLRDL